MVVTGKLWPMSNIKTSMVVTGKLWPMSILMHKDAAVDGSRSNELVDDWTSSLSGLPGQTTSLAGTKRKREHVERRIMKKMPSSCRRSLHQMRAYTCVQRHAAREWMENLLKERDLR